MNILQRYYPVFNRYIFIIVFKSLKQPFIRKDNFRVHENLTRILIKRTKPDTYYVDFFHLLLLILILIYHLVERIITQEILHVILGDHFKCMYNYLFIEIAEYGLLINVTTGIHFRRAW